MPCTLKKAWPRCLFSIKLLIYEILASAVSYFTLTQAQLVFLSLSHQLKGTEPLFRILAEPQSSLWPWAGDLYRQRILTGEILLLLK